MRSTLSLPKFVGPLGVRPNAWYYINVLMGDLSETSWWPGPRDPPVGWAGILAEPSSFVHGIVGF